MAARPFVVLASPRSGSTLLTHALADHPDALVYGELFHEHPDRRFDEAARRTLGRGMARQPSFALPACGKSDDGATYVKRVFGQRTSYAAIGFKLFTHHARQGAAASVWTYLEERADVVVVDLRRDDLIASAVSDARARATQLWHSGTPVAASAPITVDPAACYAFIERCLQHEPLVAQLRARDQLIRVDYAALTSDFPGTMRSVFVALGLRDLPAQPALRKIIQRPLADEVANWDALKAYLETRPLAARLLLE